MDESDHHAQPPASDLTRVYEAPFPERAGRLPRAGPLGQASKRQEDGFSVTGPGSSSKVQVPRKTLKPVTVTVTGLRSGFDPPDLERLGRLPHQQGLCEAARLGYRDRSPQLGAPGPDSESLDLRRGYATSFPPSQVNDSKKGSNGPAG